jgi:hypothetical protein
MTLETGHLMTALCDEDALHGERARTTLRA